MTNQEAIKQIDNLADHCNSMEKNGDEIWTKDVQALDIAKMAIKENEKLKIALFEAIRNRTVMPIGLRKGKSLPEINRMSYLCMQEILQGNILDWKRAGRSYEEGKKLAEEGEDSHGRSKMD